MGKDFCFLFYFEKFAFGTRKMDRRHKGAYVDLLIEQADLFINGKDYKMSLSYVKHVLSSDFDTWEKIKEKYSCEDDKYWNESLLEKQIARKVFTDSRKNNRLGKKKKDNTSLSSDNHMVNKDKDINKDKSLTKNVKEIIDDLNQKAGTNYKATSSKTKELISARIKEGFTVENFKTVNTKKVNEWLNTEQAKYLRPITLYCLRQFEGYLNQKENNNNISSVTKQNLKNAQKVLERRGLA